VGFNLYKHKRKARIKLAVFNFAKIQTFFALVKKEFYTLWRDKKTRGIIFLPPVLQLFIFSYAATLDITNIKIGVINKDNTEISREFIRQVKLSPYFSKIYNFKNEKEMKHALDEEKIRVGVYIKNDFTKKFKGKNTPEILTVYDGRKTNAGQITAGYINEIAANFTGGLAENAPKQNINFKIRNFYNPNLNYHWFIVASLAGILPMTTVVLLTALSLAREKEEGTFDELMVLPFSNFEIVLAKIINPLVFGVFDGILIVLISIFVFKIPFLGSVFLYLFSLTLFLLSVAGIGLFISSLTKTEQQAMLFVFVFMFPAIILSGYTTPIENITPEALQKLTLLNPLRFFLVISKGIILKNMNFYYVSLNLIPIALISTITLLGAILAFKAKK